MKNIILTTLLLVGNLLFSQDVIQLDRPDQTETVYVVPKKYLQAETGFMYEKANKTDKHFHMPSILWKYGLNDKVELRLITEFSKTISTSENAYELQPISLGFKSALIEEKGIIPKISFIGKVEFVKSEILQKKAIIPAFRFTFQNNINPKTSIGYNLGIIWNEELKETYIYTFTIGKVITNKLNYFLEMYGFISQGLRADHRINGGITYLVNKNFMLDTSAGIGLSKKSIKNFISLGISYRIKLFK